MPTYTFYDRTITAGPQQGRRVSASSTFIYKLRGDAFDEVWGLLPGQEEREVVVKRWKRVGADRLATFRAPPAARAQVVAAARTKPPAFARRRRTSVTTRLKCAAPQSPGISAAAAATALHGALTQITGTSNQYVSLGGCLVGAFHADPAQS